MTEHRLRQLYQAAANAAHEAGDHRASSFAREKAERQLAQALDLLIMGCNQREAGLIDWAMDNGYPDWETVERYGDERATK